MGINRLSVPFDIKLARKREKENNKNRARFLSPCAHVLCCEHARECVKIARLRLLPRCNETNDEFFFLIRIGHAAVFLLGRVISSLN